MSDLVIGEVWGQQLQGISNGDGSPGLHEVGCLASLLSISPVHALQELGQGPRFSDEAEAEAPHHGPLTHIQRSARPCVRYQSFTACGWLVSEVSGCLGRLADQIKPWRHAKPHAVPSNAMML